MRVVAGTARGRPLRAPPGQATRPTGDRIREAIFSAVVSLGGVEGATVVDLFAGSGAMGIEALSRRAVAATFVERDGAALATIRANLAALDLAGPGARVLALDAMIAAGSPAITGAADVVFADPPYRFVGWSELLGRLAGTGFAGLLVTETGSPLSGPEGWDVVREKAYGSTVVTMLRPASARRPEGRIQEGSSR